MGSSFTLRRYSDQQLAYMAAKAQHDTLEDEVRKIMGPCPERSEGIDAYCLREEEVRDDLGCYEVLADLRNAEKALIDWAHAIMKHQPGYAAAHEDLEKLFATKSPIFKQKVIDIAMRLEISRLEGASA